MRAKIKKFTILLFLILQTSCSFGKNDEIQAKSSIDTILVLLRFNLDIIKNIDDKTDKVLLDSIFNNIFMQLSLLNTLEEIDPKYSVSQKMLETPFPINRNEFCLINKFVISYAEKYPSKINEPIKKTLIWIERNQKELLFDLSENPLPNYSQDKCSEYKFKL